MFKQKLNVEDMIVNTKKNWPQKNLEVAITAVRLIRAGDVVLSNARKLMEQFDLTPAEFDTLATLRKMGAPYELTPTNLCRANLLSSGGLTKVLINLEKRGLINRIAHDADKRRRIVSLTIEGKSLIEQAMKQIISGHESIFTTIYTQEERIELNRLLSKFHQVTG